MPANKRLPPKRGQMITFVSPKGGTGKSTTAFSLIGAIREAEPDARVMIMDMDPQNTLADALEARLERMPTEEKWCQYFASDRSIPLTAEQIASICEDYLSRYDYLIVDTQGAAKKEAVYFSVSADIALITSMYNEAELSPAVRFYKEVKEAMQRLGIEPNLYFLETRYNHVLQDRQAKAVRRQFDSLGYPTLTTKIPNQLAFQNILSGGLFLNELAADHPNRTGYQSAYQACWNLWREIKDKLSVEE